MNKLKKNILMILALCFVFAEKLPNDIRWVVESKEYQMLCHQVYDVAEEKLRNIIAANGSHANQAIIMDLDETVLDNSRYQVENFEKGESFNMESWADWVNRSEAGLVPGVQEYINLVREMNIQLIFISNRMDARLESTKNNMKQLNIYDENDIYLLRLDKNDKKHIRREEVFKGSNRMASYGPFDVIMYIGDAMGDFPEIESHNKFILPNPMYGKW